MMYILFVIHQLDPKPIQLFHYYRQQLTAPRYMSPSQQVTEGRQVEQTPAEGETRNKLMVHGW